MSLNEYSDVVVRRVGLNRTDDLLSLEAACFQSDRISRCNLRRLLCAPSAYCAGAYRSGALVGSMVTLFRSTSRTARVYSLAVLESERGHGIGRRLMDRAEQEARRRKCVRMRLEVRMENVLAIELYKRLGFVDTAVMPGYYEDGAHAFVMRRELD